MEIQVQKRTSSEGKTIYRIKRMGTKKCLWTGDSRKIDALKAVIVFDTRGQVGR